MVYSPLFYYGNGRAGIADIAPLSCIEAELSSADTGISPSAVATCAEALSKYMQLVAAPGFFVALAVLSCAELVEALQPMSQSVTLQKSAELQQTGFQGIIHPTTYYL